MSKLNAYVWASLDTQVFSLTCVCVFMFFNATKNMRCFQVTKDHLRITSNPHWLLVIQIYFDQLVQRKLVKQKGVVFVNHCYFVNLQCFLPIFCREVIRWRDKRHPKFPWRRHRQGSSLSSAIFRFNCTWDREDEPQPNLGKLNPFFVFYGSMFELQEGEGNEGERKEKGCKKKTYVLYESTG